MSTAQKAFDRIVQAAWSTQYGPCGALNGEVKQS